MSKQLMISWGHLIINLANCTLIREPILYSFIDFIFIEVFLTALHTVSFV